MQIPTTGSSLRIHKYNITWTPSIITNYIPSEFLYPRKFCNVHWSLLMRTRFGPNYIGISPTPSTLTTWSEFGDVHGYASVYFQGARTRGIGQCSVSLVSARDLLRGCLPFRSQRNTSVPGLYRYWLGSYTTVTLTISAGALCNTHFISKVGSPISVRAKARIPLGPWIGMACIVSACIGFWGTEAQSNVAWPAQHSSTVPEVLAVSVFFKQYNGAVETY